MTRAFRRALRRRRPHGRGRPAARVGCRRARSIDATCGSSGGAHGFPTLRAVPSAARHTALGRAPQEPRTLTTPRRLAGEAGDRGFHRRDRHGGAQVARGGTPLALPLDEGSRRSEQPLGTRRGLLCCQTEHLQVPAARCYLLGGRPTASRWPSRCRWRRSRRWSRRTATCPTRRPTCPNRPPTCPTRPPTCSARASAGAWPSGARGR